MRWAILGVGIFVSAVAPAAEVPIEELIGSKPAVERDLFGEQRFGVYAHGDSFVGSLDLKVGKAKRVKGGGYEVRSTIVMGLGANQLEIKESAVVAANLATIASEGRVVESSDTQEKLPLESKKAFVDGKHWVIETWGGEATTADRVVATHPNRVGMWSMFLLGRVLGGQEPGHYTMHGVLPTGGEPAYAEVALHVELGASEPLEFRGEQGVAQLIQIKAETGWVFSLVVRDGQVLEMWSNDYPTIFAACDSRNNVHRT